MRFTGLLLLLCASLANAGPTVVASIEPLAMVARDIFGDQAQVETLLLPGQTPHFAAFTPAQAQQVQQADLLVWLGADAEPYLRALVKKGRGQRLALLDIDGIERRTDDDGHDHDHGVEGLNPHLWLSPLNMRLLARQLAAQASSLGLDPARTQQALTSFEQRLDDQLARSRQRLAPWRDTPWLSQHNPWGYFVAAMSLRSPLVISESLQSGTSSRRFAELVAQMRSEQVQCAIAEPEAHRTLMARLCQGDCRLVDADPLGRDLAGTGYVEFVGALAARFAGCLGGPAGH